MKELRNNIGFDLGSSKFRFYKEGKQIGEIPARLELDGEKHEKLVINGKIADFNGTETLLRQEIKKIQKPVLGFLYLPFNSLVSVPSDMNEVALRAFRDSMEHAGSKTCFMLNDCFIAATGLEIDIKNSTSMIVDCGAGKTSITTIKGFEIIKNDILDIAGINLDEAIRTYLSSKYDLIVDLKVAEKLKIEYTDFRENKQVDKTVRITGQVKQTDSIKDIKIQSSEITDCLRNDIELLVERIIRHFENLEDSVSEKIKMTGVYLIGGGFKLTGLIDLISKKLNVNSKSYGFSNDYMKTGLQKIQANPGELMRYMMI
ncbi:rod shape-determining protein [Prolixibacter sp. NT017]|uniref:rod shape-determining protein n=1 Tax=Prolixibacter sp. NT017 TaxID=2652390 RepID=UPI0012720061|nr:rod shape-determining protein [Prolixibacter sp. NT017]GET25184.1 hypothetical protein NT017_15130 [Prolixibacter sp. NT017]